MTHFHCCDEVDADEAYRKGLAEGMAAGIREPCGHSSDTPIVACNDPRHDEIESWYRQLLEARAPDVEQIVRATSPSRDTERCECGELLVLHECIGMKPICPEPRHHYEFDCGNCGERITALIPCVHADPRAASQERPQPLPPCPICGKDDLFMGRDGKPGCPHCEVAVTLPPASQERPQPEARSTPAEALDVERLRKVLHDEFGECAHEEDGWRQCQYRAEAIAAEYVRLSERRDKEATE